MTRSRKSEVAIKVFLRHTRTQNDLKLRVTRLGRVHWSSSIPRREAIVVNVIKTLCWKWRDCCFAPCCMRRSAVGASGCHLRSVKCKGCDHSDAITSVRRSERGTKRDEIRSSRESCASIQFHSVERTLCTITAAATSSHATQPLVCSRRH